MAILKNIDIDKGILQNIDIDKISYRLGFGISNTPKMHPKTLLTRRHSCLWESFLKSQTFFNQLKLFSQATGFPVPPAFTKNFM